MFACAPTITATWYCTTNLMKVWSLKKWGHNDARGRLSKNLMFCFLLKKNLPKTQRLQFN